MRPSTLIILLGVAVLICQGCAGTPKAPQKDSKAAFAAFDLNKDERISRNEFLCQIKDRKLAEKLFTELDTDGNGYISTDEAAAKPALMQQALRLTEPPELR